MATTRSSALTAETITAAHSDSRASIGAFMCEEGLSSLRDFCDAHYVTLTGLVDAFGHYCGLHAATQDTALPSDLLAIVQGARQVDVQRRQAGRRRS